MISSIVLLVVCAVVVQMSAAFTMVYPQPRLMSLEILRRSKFRFFGSADNGVVVIGPQGKVYQKGHTVGSLKKDSMERAIARFREEM